MRTRTRRLALAEGFSAGVLFGTAAIFIRLLQSVNAFSIAFWRLMIACAVLLLIVLVFRKSSSLNLVQRNLKDLLILSIFLALHFIFFVSAVKDTTILNATVLVNITPIFSVMVSSLLFKGKPSRMAMVGLAISFIGVGVFAYARGAIAEADSSVKGFSLGLNGDLEAVLAALAESFYLNYGRKVRSQMDILPTMMPMYLLTAAFVGLISAPFTRGDLALQADAAVILPILGLAILPTAIAHTLYFSSLSNLKSFETATMALLEPIGATILGVAVFQEMPAPLFVFGAILILTGIFFVMKNTN
jgi:drug/metabolite transporter (DMT)-like permease